MKRERIPFGTLLLILANLAFAAFILGDDTKAARWGFLPNDPSLLDALTSLLAHTNPVHLLANLVFLAAVGPAVEAAAGAIRLLACFFIAGLLGTFAHMAAVEYAQPLAAQYPLIGASSGVAGLIGYSWLRFHRRSVPLAPRLRLPVYVIVVGWLALQVWGGLSSNHYYFGPVAYWAHIGGFIGGFLLGLVFGAGGEALQEAHRERLALAKEIGPEARVAAAKDLVSRNPDDLQAHRELADAYEGTGEIDLESEQLAIIVSSTPDFDGGYAVRRLGELGGLALVGEQRRLAAAQALSKDHPHEAERLLESLLLDASAAKPDALAMLAELRAADDKESARGHAAVLAADYELSPQTAALRARRPDLFD
jgi:membrane associated rhomboid family serine protease